MDCKLEGPSTFETYEDPHNYQEHDLIRCPKVTDETEVLSNEDGLWEMEEQTNMIQNKL